ncbi:MAG: hypothetical protein BZ137_06765 [Methanosphaera sp. rholeuAM130]|nr:MAG: hypothetical protein BZ137_06765 [Methanosphaera sp. rholeuAM130]
MLWVYLIPIGNPKKLSLTMFKKIVTHRIYDYLVNELYTFFDFHNGKYKELLNEGKNLKKSLN